MGKKRIKITVIEEITEDIKVIDIKSKEELEKLFLSLEK